LTRLYNNGEIFLSGILQVLYIYIYIYKINLETSSEKDLPIIGAFFIQSNG